MECVYVIVSCSKAIELNPCDAGAYYCRAKAKYTLGRYGSAVEDYNRAIELNPNNIDAYAERGLAKGKMGIAGHDKS